MYIYTYMVVVEYTVGWEHVGTHVTRIGLPYRLHSKMPPPGRACRKATFWRCPTYASQLFRARELSDLMARVKSSNHTKWNQAEKYKNELLNRSTVQISRGTFWLRVVLFGKILERRRSRSSIPEPEIPGQEPNAAQGFLN